MHGADHSLSKKQEIKENKIKKGFSVLLNCKLSLFFLFHCVFTPNAKHFMKP